MVELPAHIDDKAVARVDALGGVQAIIASHPHMYDVVGGVRRCPGASPGGGRSVTGHTAPTDRGVDQRDRARSRRRRLAAGGHFPGSAVVHWTAPDGRGVLFSGDAIAPDREGLHARARARARLRRRRRRMAAEAVRRGIDLAAPIAWGELAVPGTGTCSPARS